MGRLRDFSQVGALVGGVCGVACVGMMLVGCDSKWNDCAYDCYDCRYDGCYDPPVSPNPPSNTLDAKPVVADIEVDGVMQKAGGDGIGVFIEYSQSEELGFWTVSTACDTDTSGYVCQFRVYLKPKGTGGWLEYVSKMGASWTHESDYDGRMTTSVQTGTSVDRIVFSYSALQPVEFTVYLDNKPEARYTYWMDQGRVHYGAPTNPIQLCPVLYENGD
ncbi:MAG: hypothetical protein FWD57_01135 [Polyangiaceae bacterium]|nr:hypothetical protein [Polyangiaceae bacterium]